MNRSVQRYLEAASGLTNLTANKAEQVVKQMVKSGEAAGDQVGELVDDLLDRQRKNRDAVAALVRSETVRAVRAMGLATTSEMERLQKQVADLKRELARVQREDTSAAPAKKTTAKKSTKKTAKKTTPAKKSAAKKSTKKTAPAKKSTKKTSKKATKKTTKKATS
jgi:polyhydroxyalkanoate synthesis regulator phasin